MGWRGTLRSIAAASRAAARENERRAKMNAKQRMISAAADAVEDWELLIKKLTTVNHIINSAMDWEGAVAQIEPLKPSNEGLHKRRATEALATFRPSFWDLFRGGSTKQQQRLEQAISAAEAQDKHEFAEATEAYNEAHANWVSETALATRVLALQPGALKEVVEEAMNVFEENLFAKSIEFQFEETYLHVIPTVLSASVVPKFRRKQLASGRLSETDMPAAQWHQIYQDYVAGIALGVANSMFHLLPIAEVYVTCKSEMLNTKTGHMEVLPILSGRFVRATMANINLETVDASDALTNFNHAVAFKRASGFSPITPLTDALT